MSSHCVEHDISLYFIEMSLETVHDSSFRLSYVLFSAGVTCDAVDQIATSACEIFHAPKCSPCNVASDFATVVQKWTISALVIFAVVHVLVVSLSVRSEVDLLRITVGWCCMSTSEVLAVISFGFARKFRMSVCLGRCRPVVTLKSRSLAWGRGTLGRATLAVTRRSRRFFGLLYPTRKPWL